ncbi:MAG: TRAP transporter substrate-binding protein [Pseudomonadota bacterium]
MCTAALALLAGPLAAQEVTLKLHEFLPAGSTVPREIVHVWADKIEEESQNRIKIDRFSGMALGGAPPELMDQTIDGVTDIAWTVVGYTPGRFPQTEVFELPFQLRDGAEASCAFWTMYEEHMTEDFADVKVLGTWVHGPGVIHSAEPVETPADLDGLKVRGGSRIVNEVLEAAGATPVGMPVPAVPEALSKGVIDATTIPWEVTGSLKTSDLVEYHTEFEGEWLYTLTFVMVMNKDVFAGLPADLQAVIEENSGLDFSIFAGKTQQAFDAPEREVAVENGNEIFLVTETGPWTAAVTPIIADWVADMSEIGVDGQALIDQSQALMAGQCAGADADL